MVPACSTVSVVLGVSTGSFLSFKNINPKVVKKTANIINPINIPLFLTVFIQCLLFEVLRIYIYALLVIERIFFQ